jgi:hypothetical protein
MIYHLEIQAENCDILGLVNGFPIYELKAQFYTSFSMPINIALITGINKLILNAIPYKQSNLNENELKLEKFKITGCIKQYKPKNITGPESGKTLIKFDFSNQLISYEDFTISTIDFSNRIINAQKIDDENSIVKYIMYIINLFSAKKTELLLQEFYEKLKDYSIAFGQSEDFIINDFKNHLIENFFPAKPIINIVREDILLTKFCDGRIWRVNRKTSPNKDFFQTEFDAEGYNYSIPIFVGFANGKLNIIR